MHKFRAELHGIMGTNKVSLNRVWNAEQSGLYRQKFPNRMYCLPKERSTIRGVKQMKDKTRKTLMICTSAGGDKIPLAHIYWNKPHISDAIETTSFRLPLAQYRYKANCLPVLYWCQIEVDHPQVQIESEMGKKIESSIRVQESRCVARSFSHFCNGSIQSKY